MRNTSQYPITPEEVDQALERAIERSQSGPIVLGDIQPYSLTLAQAFLKEREGDFTEWLERECSQKAI